MVSAAELNNEERKILIKILEDAKSDETDKKLLNIIIENLQKLNQGIIDDDVLSWFDGYFNMITQPEDITENNDEIEVARNLLKKFGVDSDRTKSQCIKCHKFVPMTQAKEIIMKNGMKALKGKCGTCNGT